METNAKHLLSIWDAITVPGNIGIDALKKEWKKILLLEPIIQDEFTFYTAEDGNTRKIILRLTQHYVSIIDQKQDILKLVISLAYVKCRWTTILGRPVISFVHAGLIFHFSSTIEVVEKWKGELRKLVVVDDFHDVFNVEKLIKSEKGRKILCARHKQTGKKYTVKQISKRKKLDTPLLIKQLYNYIKIMRTLGKNDHTAELIEVHDTKNSFYLIMEHLGGETLLSVEPLTEGESSAILSRVLKSIEFCHDNGIMHRDI